ncbi:MAG: hypothetical protein PVJ17_09445 [Lysobacterales bacterium]
MPRAALAFTARTLTTATLIGAAACSAPPPSTPATTPAGSVETTWPGFDYASAAMRALGVFELEPGESRIDVVARRSGPLAGFGHDHVVRIDDAEGYLMLGAALENARGDIRFGVETLRIDEARDRERYGLDTQPDDEDIEGTRENLLGHVLDPSRWPAIELQLSEFRREPEGFSAQVRFFVDGAVHSARESFQLEHDSGRVVASGEFPVLQTDLGLIPFSALGGALRVADRLVVHFEITGAPIQPGE